MVSPRGSSCVLLGETLRFEAHRHRVGFLVPVLPYAFALGVGGYKSNSAALNVLPAGTSVGKVEMFAMRGGESLPGSVGITCCVIVFVSSCRVYSVFPGGSHELQVCSIINACIPIVWIWRGPEPGGC